jgi:sortase A
MLAALALGGHAAWLPAKAVLAQQLLDQAWDASLADGAPHRPWPWADTHPVARLGAPRLGISQVVLAGDAGRPLAFGPGWAEASAAPGTPGTTIISGHRDTHFRWLEHLRDGDWVSLESADPRGRGLPHHPHRDVINRPTGTRHLLALRRHRPPRPPPLRRHPRADLKSDFF